MAKTTYITKAEFDNANKQNATEHKKLAKKINSLGETQAKILHSVDWSNGAWEAMAKGLWDNIGRWIAKNKAKAFSLSIGFIIVGYPILTSLLNYWGHALSLTP